MFSNIVNILLSVVQAIVLILLAPLVIGFIRKVKARLQSRKGPKIIQPYYDLSKLFKKESVVSTKTSWIFKITPYICMGAVISTSLMVPLFFASSLDMIGGIMVAMYFLIIMRVFMILSGLDAGTSFGGMGSSREAMISALTEPIILLCLFTSAIITNTMYLGAISATLASNPTMMLEPSLFLAFFAFFIATLAENARVPFDNPATHLELTMVHEAMLIEYSGKQLGLMEYSSWIKHLIFFSILANAFFPLGIAVDLSLTSILVGIGAYLIKIFVIALIVAFIESSIAKLRLFQVPNLLGIGFALALMAILLLHIL